MTIREESREFATQLIRNIGLDNKDALINAIADLSGGLMLERAKNVHLDKMIQAARLALDDTLFHPSK